MQNCGTYCSLCCWISVSIDPDRLQVKSSRRYSFWWKHIRICMKQSAWRKSLSFQNHNHILINIVTHLSVTERKIHRYLFWSFLQSNQTAELPNRLPPIVRPLCKRKLQSLQHPHPHHHGWPGVHDPTPNTKTKVRRHARQYPTLMPITSHIWAGWFCPTNYQMIGSLAYHWYHLMVG